MPSFQRSRDQTSWVVLCVVNNDMLTKYSLTIASQLSTQLEPGRSVRTLDQSPTSSSVSLSQQWQIGMGSVTWNKMARQQAGETYNMCLASWRLLTTSWAQVENMSCRMQQGGGADATNRIFSVSGEQRSMTISSNSWVSFVTTSWVRMIRWNFLFVKWPIPSHKFTNRRSWEQRWRWLGRAYVQGLGSKSAQSHAAPCDSQVRCYSGIAQGLRVGNSSALWEGIKSNRCSSRPHCHCRPYYCWRLGRQRCSQQIRLKEGAMAWHGQLVHNLAVKKHSQGRGQAHTTWRLLFQPVFSFITTKLGLRITVQLQKKAQKSFTNEEKMCSIMLSAHQCSQSTHTHRERERKRRFLCCRNISLVMGYMTLMPTYFGFYQFLITAAKPGAYRSFATWQTIVMTFV